MCTYTLVQSSDFVENSSLAVSIKYYHNGSSYNNVNYKLLPGNCFVVSFQGQSICVIIVPEKIDFDPEANKIKLKTIAGKFQLSWLNHSSIAIPSNSLWNI